MQQGKTKSFHFDAYGNLLNFSAGQTPITSYLYSGEAFDFNIGQQYLRARFYDPTNGRFNRLDPFYGNSQDPQSFHKYAYVHGDPIQGIDPTGKFLGLGGVLSSINAALSRDLPLLTEGLLIGFTLETIGGAGGTIRNYGLAQMALGNMDTGQYYYDMGTRIMGLAFFTAQTVSDALGFLQLGMAVGQFGRLAASKLLKTRTNKIPDFTTHIGGATPRVTWRPNANGVVRSGDEIVDLARQNGVNIPDWVDIRLDSNDLNIIAEPFKKKTGRAGFRSVNSKPYCYMGRIDRW